MRQRREAIIRAFEKLPVLQQTTLLVLMALIATEILVVIFYSIFFEERLLLDMVLSGVIVLVVGYPIGYVVIGQNVKLRRLTLELDRAARIDSLTGLANRRTFFAEAGRAFAAGQHGRGAFLYIDADHFKQINDDFGHAAGDMVLRAIATAIRSCVRQDETVARLGGEEFGVYLSGADRSIAMDVAERIRRRTARIGFGTGLGPDAVTVSIGMAMREGGETLEALMARADRNLYAAKQSGRNRIVAGPAGGGIDAAA